MNSSIKFGGSIRWIKFLCFSGRYPNPAAIYSASPTEFLEIKKKDRRILIARMPQQIAAVVE